MQPMQVTSLDEKCRVRLLFFKRRFLLLKLSKKVGKSGSISIPKQLRTEAGIFAGNAIDIEVTKDGINIKPHTDTCCFCGSTVKVKRVLNTEICRECALQIYYLGVCNNE